MASVDNAWIFALRSDGGRRSSYPVREFFLSDLRLFREFGIRDLVPILAVCHRFSRGCRRRLGYGRSSRLPLRRLRRLSGSSIPALRRLRDLGRLGLREFTREGTYAAFDPVGSYLVDCILPKGVIGRSELSCRFIDELARRSYREFGKRSHIITLEARRDYLNGTLNRRFVLIRIGDSPAV